MKTPTSSIIRGANILAIDSEAGLATALPANRGRSGTVHGAASSAAIKLRDRAAEFRRARRHSMQVKLLKALLPLMAAALVGVYFLPSFLSVSIDNGKGTATVKSITLEAGALKMINPHVNGVNDSQGVYDVVADSATQEAKSAEIMHLDKIRGKITSQQGQVTTLTAPDGVYNNKTEVITFNNGALVNREPGMSAAFQTATVYMKQQMVESKTPVIVRLHESTIHAQTMSLYTGEQRAIFEGNVRTHLERRPVEGGNGSAGDPSPAAGNDRNAEAGDAGAWHAEPEKGR